MNKVFVIFASVFVLTACASSPKTRTQERCNAEASNAPALLVSNTAAPGLYSDNNKKIVRAARIACMREAGF